MGKSYDPFKRHFFSLAKVGPLDRKVALLSLTLKGSLLLNIPRNEKKIKVLFFTNCIIAMIFFFHSNTRYAPTDKLLADLSVRLDVRWPNQILQILSIHIKHAVLPCQKRKGFLRRKCFF
jgi:hypothetical protein